VCKVHALQGVHQPCWSRSQRPRPVPLLPPARASIPRASHQRRPPRAPSSAPPVPAHTLTHRPAELPQLPGHQGPPSDIQLLLRTFPVWPCEISAAQTNQVPGSACSRALLQAKALRESPPGPQAGPPRSLARQKKREKQRPCSGNHSASPGFRKSSGAITRFRKAAANSR